MQAARVARRHAYGRTRAQYAVLELPGGVGGGWPQTFEDVAAAIDLLAELDAPLDLADVFAVGHSAGGQRALWATSSTSRPPAAPGPTS